MKDFSKDVFAEWMVDENRRYHQLCLQGFGLGLVTHGSMSVIAILRQESTGDPIRYNSVSLDPFRHGTYRPVGPAGDGSFSTPSTQGG